MPISTTPAMAPASPPIIAGFCELWLLCWPAVAGEADALSCVSAAEGAPEKVPDGALLVAGVGKGKA